MTDQSKILTRRDALVALGSSTATLAGCARPALAKSAPPSPPNTRKAPTATRAGASPLPSPLALGGAHSVIPLPFKSTALNGISEKMIVSHHDNNYAGAVKNLNNVEQELSQITAETSIPILVMDMYEHAYQMDFGAAAAKNIDAFFTNVRWDEVNHRYERALAASKALRG